MSQEALKLQLQNLLTQLSEGEYHEGIADDSDLLLQEVIDSFGYVQLIAELEKLFSITLDEDDQLDPRLRTLAGLMDFVAERQG